MIDGIYHVRFSSNSKVFGEGLATFKDGSVNGGDHGYLYLGKINSLKGKVLGSLLVKRWNSAVASVFGNIPEFKIELAGSQSADRSFQADGKVAGQPNFKIHIAGRFLSELA